MAENGGRTVPHVAVIGAGITGVAAALQLQRAGARVTLIDRWPPGSRGQASFGNGGILARAAVAPVSVPGLLAKVPRMLADPDGPLFVRWGRVLPALPWLWRFFRAGRRAEVTRIAAALSHLVGDSVDEHRALARGTRAERHIQTGRYGYLYRNREAFERDAFGWAIRRKHGFEWTTAERDELLAEDPNLGEEVGFAAILRDHGWITDPGAYVADLAEVFQREGGVFHRGFVSDLRPRSDGGVRVTVGGECLNADRAVLVGGVWSERLARRLRIRTPLESERGYHLALRNPTVTPPYPYMMADAKFVATPMEGALRCAGLVELGGLDPRPSMGPPALLERAVRKLYPDLSWSRAEVWLGHRPSPPDSLPYLGPCPGAPDILFGFGAQHVGLTAGPKIGRLLADMALRRAPNIDMTPFRVERFDERARLAALQTTG